MRIGVKDDLRKEMSFSMTASCIISKKDEEQVLKEMGDIMQMVNMKFSARKERISNSKSTLAFMSLSRAPPRE